MGNKTSSTCSSLVLRDVVLDSCGVQPPRVLA